ncbi:MAG TPA: efflux RND transporter periplasmic adaptor subunit [Gemmatimonadaceae bacterium]|nr:efflux RND transporter periplasmic adaptor subunit [Gemmatimonadaceae bacterium]
MTDTSMPNLPARRVAPSLAVLLAALAVAACGRGEANAEPASGKTVEVGPQDLAVVAERRIESGPQMSGSLQPDREATVRAEVAGTVLQTFVDQGNRVGAGTMLARIDDTSIRDAFLSARSGLTAAQTSADVAKRDLERSEKLAAAGAIADRDVENARRANLASQSQLADAKARFTAMEEQLAKTTVKAPFAGVVSVRSVNAGDLASPGAALFTIVDPTSMRLEGAVPSEQLASVRLGMPVTFTVQGYPGKTFTGRITRINPVADPVTRQVRILASIPNDAGTLVGGLFAEGRVSSEARTGIVVPIGAVNQRDFVPTVTRVKNGRTEKVAVETGIQDSGADVVEIRKGLAPGDTVLTGGAQGLEPGTTIRVQVVRDRVVSSNR